MDVKTWLVNMDKLNRRVSMQERRAANIRAEVEYKSPSFGGSGGGSFDPHRKEGRLAELMDLEERIKAGNEKLASMRKKAAAMFDSFNDPDLEYIFYSRYLDGYLWSAIIESSGLSEGWVHKLHGKGLNILRSRFGSLESEGE